MSLHHKDRTQDIDVEISTVTTKLKRRQISGSYSVALETCQLLMRVISLSRWHQPDELLNIVRQTGKRLIAALPREFSSGNVVRRVLSMIRDEINDDDDEANGQGHGHGNSHNNHNTMISSMFSLLSTSDKSQGGAEKSKLKNQDLRSVIIQGIRDLMDEISSISENIETMSVDLIHDNEVLLTPTPGSKTVLNFLIKARQKRKFTVLVTESFPNDTEIAHNFAKTLAEANIETVVIPDATVYAMMSRVGKVIVGARSVFANGGCITSAGVLTCVECAKEHKTPVFVTAGLYKLSPTYPFDRNSLIEVGNSGKVIPYQDSQLVGNCEVTNPLFDYVVPENIDIYITNIGGFAPSFIYRIVIENYKTEDVNLD